MSDSPGDITLVPSLLLVLTALFQCSSLGTIMTVECKPTGKRFGVKHCNDLEPDGLGQEERLKELKPWILLVTLQGCPGCKRPTAALSAVLGEMMRGRDCCCSLERKGVNEKKGIWRYPAFKISSEGGSSRTESHKGKW